MKIKNPIFNYSLFCIVLFAAGATFYRESLTSIALAVVNREDSSHGLFVPLIACYFLWLNRKGLSSNHPKFDVIGILFVFIVLFATLLVNTSIFQLKFVLYILLILSSAYAFLGRTILSIAGFPILFLLAATPLPDELYMSIANLSRTLALGASLKIISLLGIPYFRDGWHVQLPTGHLLVNVGCSGIRYLISYFVFSVAYAYLFKTGLVKRVILVVCSLPVSLMASILRLTSIFSLSYYIDPRFADKNPHIIISWIIFFIVMFFAVWIDQKVYSDQPKTSAAPKMSLHQKA